MIRFKLFNQVLVLLLTVSSLLSLVLFFVLQWSFGKGFIDYVNHNEEQRLQRLEQLIILHYQQQGHFAEFSYSPVVWPDLVFRSQDNIPLSNTDPIPRGILPDPNRFEQRIAFFNKDKKRLAGPAFVEFEQFIPIIHTEKIIAYLSYKRPNSLSKTQDINFAAQIQQNFLFILITFTVLSTLLAIPLARGLTQPVRALRDATSKLSSGHYDIHFPAYRSDEIGDLQRDIAHLGKALRDHQTSRQRWIADISHELRTPMTILHGEIEAMLDGVRRSDRQQLLSLREESCHLQTLIEDLHELSLSDLGALSYQKTALDLKRPLMSALEYLTPLIEQRSLQLQLELPEQALMVHADQTRLRQLFLNILHNAIRYTEVGGTIRIHYNYQSMYHQLIIEDSPPGVDESVLNKLFERFYRQESSRNRNQGGSGLGLAICQQIVHAHDGEISLFQSSLGGLGIKVTLEER